MPAGRYRNPSREATPMNIRTVLLVRVPTLCAEVGLGCGGDDRAASTAQSEAPVRKGAQSASA